MMEVIVGQLRGLGYSLFPMIVTLVGVCGLRILWIYTIFAAFPVLETLIWSYPLSWFLTVVCHFATYYVVQKKLPKDDLPMPAHA